MRLIFRRSLCTYSPVEVGRAPPSTSARRTHVRNVSAVIPDLEAIEVTVAHCNGCSAWCSKIMRTAPRLNGEVTLRPQGPVSCSASSCLARAARAIS